MKSHLLVLGVLAGAEVAAFASGASGAGAGADAAVRNVGSDVRSASVRTESADTATATVPVTTWAKVVNAPGELSLWRTVTSYALTCDVAEFPRALEESAKWPKARADVAQRVLLQSWVTRETEAAIAWRGKVAWSLSDAARTGFYRGLAVLDAKRALELAKTETSLTVSANAEQAVLEAIVDTDRERAFELASDRSIFSEEGAERTLVGVVWRLAEIDPSAALVASQRIKNPQSAAGVRFIAFSDLFKGGPAAALSAIRQIRMSVSERDWLIVQQVTVYGSRDLKAAQILMENEKDPEIRRVIGEGISRALFYVPPALAWEYLRNNGGKMIQPELAWKLGEYAIGRPREEARAFFNRFAPSILEDGSTHVESFARSWAAVDADAAMAWAATLSNPALGNALIGVNEQLLEVDPAKAFRMFDGPLESELKNFMMDAAVRKSGLRNFQETLSWVMAWRTGEAQEYALKVLAGICAQDRPLTFIAALNKLPAGPSRTTALVAMGEAWSNYDTIGAAEWFLKLPAGEVRNADLRGKIFDDLAAECPEIALKKVHGLAQDDRQELIGRLAQRAIADHPEEIFSAIKTFLTGEQKDEAINYAFNAFAEKDPGGLSDFVLKGHVEIDADNIPMVAGQWAQLDPASAAKWLTGLKADSVSPQVLQAARIMLTSNWAAFDPESALVWLDSWPEGAVRHAEKIELGKTFMLQDPVNGLELLTELGATQEDLMDSARRLFSRYPDRAQKWVNESALSPESKVALIGVMTR